MNMKKITSDGSFFRLVQTIIL